MTDLRITVKNTSEIGGTFLTPVYFGFHDGSFDLFDLGESASAGLESLAEDGSPAALAAERLAADADSQGLVVTGDAGPVATQETTSGTISVNGASNGFVSFASMIIPSNDAFIGTNDAIRLFNGSGDFIREQTITIDGSNVYDAGTEVNTELDAAFINQTGPNTGLDENGVVHLHPGFNGSEGNPVGDGDQIILGGTNAAGAAITEEADFTRDGAQIAEIHINTVLEHDGTAGRDVILGGRDDDLVDAGAGNDIILTYRGWDVIDAGDGQDLVYAGSGDDLITGGSGNDTLYGGTGDDTFLFAQGDDIDRIADFNRRGDDTLAIAVDGIDSYEDLLETAREVGNGTRFEFDGGDTLILRGVGLDELSASDFTFVESDYLIA
ncbi:MAG: spondin domain-containing protein [Marinibacterium sp.]|nr:spondin domain-containing protein [Marinibacterium sp.]